MQNLDYAKLILDVIPPTMRHVRDQMRSTAKSELTIPQFRILGRLSRSELTNSETAEWMGVSPPTMSRMIDPLVKRSLVKRNLQSKDRRQVILSLTTEGQNLYSRIRKRVQLKLAEKVSNLTHEKKKALEAGLSVLREIFL